VSSLLKAKGNEQGDNRVERCPPISQKKIRVRGRRAGEKRRILFGCKKTTSQGNKRGLNKRHGKEGRSAGNSKKNAAAMGGFARK